MLRNRNLIAACVLTLAICALGRAQDAPSQSLGDIARQAQKDKANKPPAKVITNDDVSAGSGGFSSALGMGSGQTSGKTGGGQSSPQDVEKLEGMLNQLDALDRPTLAANVLGADKNTNFPGRDKWEEKMFTAKQAFVIQSRDVFQKMKQLQAASEKIRNVDDPNDALAKNMAIRLNLLMQESLQASSSFKAVIEEGKDLAAQGAAH